MRFGVYFSPAELTEVYAALNARVQELAEREGPELEVAESALSVVARAVRLHERGKS